MEKTTRKVVTRSPAHTVRLIHLTHLQTKPIEADSTPERGFVHIAALFPATSGIEQQPFKLVWEDATYTPDFLVSFADGTKLVAEVKPESKVGGYRGLFDRAAEKLRNHHLPFIVASDKQINIDGRAENALLIRRYGKAAYPKGQCEKALDVVNSSSDGISLRYLSEIQGVPAEVVMHLVARRCLMLDRYLNVGADAHVFPIHLHKEDSHAIQFASWFDFQVWE